MTPMQYELTLLYQYINDLSQQLDLHEVLGNAESLFHSVRSQPDIPFNIRSHILRIVDSTLSSMDDTQNNTAQSDDTPDPSDNVAQDPASLLVQNVSSKLTTFKQ